MIANQKTIIIVKIDIENEGLTIHRLSGNFGVLKVMKINELIEMKNTKLNKNFNYINNRRSACILYNI